MHASRPDGALLAGVCSGIAQAFHWNVWALRALFVVFLLVKTLWAVVAYAVAAVAMHLFSDRIPSRSRGEDDLASPELSSRSERIADLERRFRDLENGQ